MVSPQTSKLAVLALMTAIASCGSDGASSDTPTVDASDSNDDGGGTSMNDGGPDTDAAIVAPFRPSNLSPDDLVAGTKDVDLSSASIDTTTGTIAGLTLDAADTRVQSQGSMASEIAVFRFRRVTISGPVTVTGSRALAIVASDSITITGSGSLSFVTTSLFAGCPSGGYGENSNGYGGGGGGGGFGAVGAKGADAIYGMLTVKGGTGGSTAGTAALVPLVHGCNGKDGGGTYGGIGGSAGGAIQLVAVNSITVDGSACVSGSGGGGHLNKGGGGGASGGAVLLEAQTVQLGGTGKLVANGGGGGGRQPGQRSCDPAVAAPGGISGGSAGPGGSGGYGTTPSVVGAYQANSGGGGGGGGVGRIRINAGSNSPGGTISPAASFGSLTPI